MIFTSWAGIFKAGIKEGCKKLNWMFHTWKSTEPNLINRIALFEKTKNLIHIQLRVNLESRLFSHFRINRNINLSWLISDQIKSILLFHSCLKQFTRSFVWKFRIIIPFVWTPLNCKLFGEYTIWHSSSTWAPLRIILTTANMHNSPKQRILSRANEGWVHTRGALVSRWASWHNVPYCKRNDKNVRHNLQKTLLKHLLICGT